MSEPQNLENTVDMIRYMRQHGPLLKLIITLKSIKRLSVVQSKDYNIYNLVSMRFKATQKPLSDDNSQGYLIFYTSIKKHESAKDMTVSLKIICDEHTFRKDKIPCSEHWCDWIRIFDTLFFKIYTAYIEIDLEATAIKEQSIIDTNLYHDETLTDFTLSAIDGSVAVHRAYLAAHSDTFATMFNGQWKETKENRIELKGVTRQCLEDFKKYIYFSTLPDDNEALRPLLLIATQYMINSLKAECTMKLLQTITAENLDSVVEFCAENALDELLRSIYEIIPEKVLAKGYVKRIKSGMSSA